MFRRLSVFVVALAAGCQGSSSAPSGGDGRADESAPLECAESKLTPLGENTADLERFVEERLEVTRSNVNKLGDKRKRQIRAAFAHLELGADLDMLVDLVESVDDEEIALIQLDIDGGEETIPVDWLQLFDGGVERGVAFEDDTTVIMAEMRDGTISGCGAGDSEQEETEPEAKACNPSAGMKCGKDEFCDFEDGCGEAGATGVCKPAPDVCAAVFRPVCGCDGNTHSNSCRAHAAGTDVDFQAPCN